MNLTFDGLAPVIRRDLDRDIISGDVFIILSKQRARIKIFVYENKGFSVLHRRLDEGSFQLPLIVSDHLTCKMSAEQMMLMLSGKALGDGGILKADKCVMLHGSM